MRDRGGEERRKERGTAGGGVDGGPGAELEPFPFLPLGLCRPPLLLQLGLQLCADEVERLVVLDRVVELVRQVVVPLLPVDDIFGGRTGVEGLTERGRFGGDPFELPSERLELAAGRGGWDGLEREDPPLTVFDDPALGVDDVCIATRSVRRRERG